VRPDGGLTTVLTSVRLVRPLWRASRRLSRPSIRATATRDRDA
jgi:hypothetical protein